MQYIAGDLQIGELPLFGDNAHGAPCAALLQGFHQQAGHVARFRAPHLGVHPFVIAFIVILDTGVEYHNADIQQ